MTIYVRVSEPIEVKKKLLESKRDIYLQLHTTLEELRNRQKKIKLLNEALEKIGEMNGLLTRLKDLLPPREEVENIKKKKAKEEQVVKRRGRKKKSKEETIEQEEEVKVLESPKKTIDKETIRFEIDELKQIEEELQKIEEELKNLV